IIEELLANNSERLASIVESQKNFINKHAADEILKLVLDAEKEDYVPVKKKRFSIAYAINK
ncbi:hypothetical protein, partial [Neobacillus cucumis]|uniref:hypothetical protein n=1 Tax=Neobacillus cucumis TaxID=1740721 RepID=UPI002EBE3056|nr:hypothetical protein [Neobacillus cucumis]